MGLKINNFYVKEMKETLPQANAVIRSLEVNPDGSGVAVIGIHRTRELALDPEVKPFHEEKIYFNSDRNTNDRTTVYKKATEPYTEKDFDPNTGELVDIVKYPYFYGWLNDIHG